MRRAALLTAALWPSLAWASGTLRGLGAVLAVVFVGAPLVGVLLAVRLAIWLLKYRELVGRRGRRFLAIVRWAAPLASAALLVVVWTATDGDAEAELWAWSATAALGLLSLEVHRAATALRRSTR